MIVSLEIQEIKVKQYLLPLDPPFKAAWDPNPRKQFATTIVYVHTDEGVTGIGPGDLMFGFSGHEHLFIGKGPFLIDNFHTLTTKAIQS